MKVLMVSRYFLKGHYRESEPTFFMSKIREGKKIHTLRENKKGHFKNHEEISLRQWSGRPYASKQVEFAQTVITIEPIYISAAEGRITACRVFGGTDVDVVLLALNDGLNMSDFLDWFFPDGSGEWTGDIIHFTDFRYGK